MNNFTKIAEDYDLNVTAYITDYGMLINVIENNAPFVSVFADTHCKYSFNDILVDPIILYKNDDCERMVFNSLDDAIDYYNRYDRLCISHFDGCDDYALFKKSNNRTDMSRIRDSMSEKYKKATINNKELTEYAKIDYVEKYNNYSVANYCLDKQYAQDLEKKYKGNDTILGYINNDFDKTLSYYDIFGNCTFLQDSMTFDTKQEGNIFRLTCVDTGITISYNVGESELNKAIDKTSNPCALVGIYYLNDYRSELVFFGENNIIYDLDKLSVGEACTFNNNEYKLEKYDSMESIREYSVVENVNSTNSKYKMVVKKLLSYEDQ